MKARYSEEYFRSNWDKYMKETSYADYINMNEELEYRMRTYQGLLIPDEELKKIEKGVAQQIIDKYSVILKNTMKQIQNLELGKASLGYNDRVIESNEMTRKIERFEFNCLQFKDFKKAHIG